MWTKKKSWLWMTKRRFARSFRRCWKRKDTTAPFARTGGWRWKLFARTRYDLVLSDIVMPEMDGLKLLAELRQEDPDVPVIMVTAMHDISIALEAIRAGAYDYILKPFEKDQLHLSVRRALEHRQSGDRKPDLPERSGASGGRAHAAAFDRVAGSGAILRLHAGSTGRRAGRERCRNGGPLPARDGVHDHHRESHGRGQGAAAAHRARSVSARHRQDGRAGPDSAQAGAADGRRARNHAAGTAISDIRCWSEFPS